MVNRVISLSEELNEELKKEENASGLIAELLTKYYKTNVKNIPDIEERQKQIEEERRKFQEKYSEDYAILEKRKQLIKQEVETLEQLRERQKKRREEQVKSIIDWFKVLVGREMSNEELSEYLLRYENEAGFNMYKFVDEITENAEKH